MNKANIIWQAVRTYWKYKFVDPVLKTGYLLVVGGFTLMTAIPGAIYLLVEFDKLPASFEIGSQTPAGWGLILTLIGVGLVVWRSSSLSSKTSGVLILHRCMAGMQSTDPTPALPTKMKMGDLITINQDDQLLQRDGITIDAPGLLRKASGLDEQWRTRIADDNKVPIAYAGLAAVPLLVTAGYKLTNRQEILIMDYDRDAGWHLLDSLDDGRSLNIAPPNGVVSTDVAIAVSVSAPISPNDIPDHLRDVCFTAVLDGGPHRDSASSVVKQQRLCRELYDLLAQIRAEYPELQVVHAFLATQASLAFRIGQTITQSVHPPVRVYQFENRRYAWSVQIEPCNEPRLIEDIEKQAS